jgi:hypothetical protein
MRFRLLFIVLASVLCVNCVAQQASLDQPASKEDVQRYLDTIHAHDMTRQMVSAMLPPLHKMIHDEYLKDKDKLPADFETRMNQMLDSMLKDMPFDEMMAAMVPSYQKHFTKGDMEGLVQFYSSSTGQKILREMPAIMAEAMQAMAPIMQKRMEDIQGRLQQQIAELLKEPKPSPDGSSSQN